MDHLDRLLRGAARFGDPDQFDATLGRRVMATLLTVATGFLFSAGYLIWHHEGIPEGKEGGTWGRLKLPPVDVVAYLATVCFLEGIAYAVYATAAVYFPLNDLQTGDHSNYWMAQGVKQMFILPPVVGAMGYTSVPLITFVVVLMVICSLVKIAGENMDARFVTVSFSITVIITITLSIGARSTDVFAYMLPVVKLVQEAAFVAFRKEEPVAIGRILSAFVLDIVFDLTAIYVVRS